MNDTDRELGGLQWLSDATTHHRSTNNNLANQIADFNTITQYGAFELLRRQQPAEATRLGIPEATGRRRNGQRRRLRGAVHTRRPAGQPVPHVGPV